MVAIRTRSSVPNEGKLMPGFLVRADYIHLYVYIYICIVYIYMYSYYIYPNPGRELNPQHQKQKAGHYKRS